MRKHHGPRILMALCLAAAPVGAEEILEASDSFDGAAVAAGAPPTEASAIAAVAYPPAPFDVQVTPGPAGGRPHAELRFSAPSPVAGRGDRAEPVRVCWWRPRSPTAQVAELAEPRPAALIVHSLAPGQPLARGLANALAAGGLDAFVVDLPGYGDRPPTPGRSPGAEAVLSGAGGVADVRRALDAIAALPEIDGDRLLLGGVSLGSFAASTVAALDGKPVALVSFLGGGSAFEGLRDGEKDAAFLREELLRGGQTLETLEALLHPIEPVTLARRLDPARVWVATATGDRVIRPENAERFVRAVGGVGLAADHWIRRPGNHYTAGFALPGVAALILEIAQDLPRGTGLAQ